MTPAQESLYWREWGRVHKVHPRADRHALHVQALGHDRSHKDFTNGDFSAVLSTFRALSDAANLNVQFFHADEPRRKLIWNIKDAAPLAYWSHICKCRYKHTNLEALTFAELSWLLVTVKGKGRKPKPVTQRQIAEAQGISCPF